jgi:galactokinase
MDPEVTGRCASGRETVFGKPAAVGSVRQSVGGLVAIDFADPAHAALERVPFDFASAGYRTVVVDTGGSHAGLTEEYAAIRTEMEQVAACFGARVLRQVDEEAFYRRLPEIIARTSHPAALRAMHFFGENRRVAEQARALRAGDLEEFFDQVVASGESSWMWLQNCYVAGDVAQGIPMALAISRRMLRGRGAWRVHGGGFAGTILAFVPDFLLDEYLNAMDGLFGKGAAVALSIRNPGAVEVRI